MYADFISIKTMEIVSAYQTLTEGPKTNLNQRINAGVTIGNEKLCTLQICMHANNVTGLDTKNLNQRISSVSFCIFLEDVYKVYDEKFS